jgi:hypothetical protein
VPTLLRFAAQANVTHADVSVAFALSRSSSSGVSGGSSGRGRENFRGSFSFKSKMSTASVVELAPRCLKLAMHLGLVRRLFAGCSSVAAFMQLLLRTLLLSSQ